MALYRGGDGDFDVADGLGHGLADEVELAHLFDAGGGLLKLAPGEELLEDAAGVGEADDHDVAGVGDLVAEEHAHDAELHLALGLTVDHGVAPGAKDPEEAVFLALEDAEGDQAGEGLSLNFLGAQRGLFDPEAGVVLFARGDLGERRIEQVVAGGGGVEQDEVLEVGVDAVLHGEVHEHAAGEGVVEGPAWDVREPSVVVVQQEEGDFLDESQHGARPFRCGATPFAAHSTRRMGWVVTAGGAAGYWATNDVVTSSLTRTV